MNSDERSPWMDSELAMLADTARRFFETECVPHEPRWAEAKQADRSIWNRAGELGLLCASIPEAYGGGGGNFLHEAVICQAQAGALVSSFSINVHSAILAHYILAYGSEAQKDRWLPAMARGEMVGAIAMTEPGAGSDLQAMRTSAVRIDGNDGDGTAGGYRVNGAKTFITNGHHADLICVAAKTTPGRGSKGVSLFMLEVADLPGFRRGRHLDKIGQRGQDTAELFFDDVHLPADALLGGVEGQGFAQLMGQLPRERLMIAIGAAATMQRAVQETAAYCRQREVFGQPLISLQNTRFKLAECHTQATVARRFVDDCVLRLMRGDLDGETAAMAKWWVTDTNCRVIDECLQLHGGYGVMNEYPIARMYTDSRVGRIYGGSNEIMKELIARSLAR